MILRCSDLCLCSYLDAKTKEGIFHHVHLSSVNASRDVHSFRLFPYPSTRLIT